MPRSITSICNNALGLLGKPPMVEDADAGTPQQYDDAAAVVDGYHARVGRVLRSHNWNCAERLSVIDAAEEAPLFGFARKYPVPPNCAGIWALDKARHGNDPKYRLRGDFIETDEASPLHLIWIERVEPSAFDDDLAAALETAIAEYAALRVLGSKEAARAFRGEAREDLADAKHNDAKQNPAQEIDGGSWLSGRSTG
jgi:hypothetical protein